MKALVISLACDECCYHQYQKSSFFNILNRIPPMKVEDKAALYGLNWILPMNIEDKAALYGLDLLKLFKFYEDNHVLSLVQSHFIICHLYY